MTPTDERRARALCERARERALIGPPLTDELWERLKVEKPIYTHAFFDEAKIVRLSDEAAHLATYDRREMVPVPRDVQEKLINAETSGADFREVLGRYRAARRALLAALEGDTE